VVNRWNDAGRVSYQLTNSGWELEPIVEALGAWGVRWIPELGDQDLDPHLLLWDMHRNLDTDAMPPGRTVLKFIFPDCPASSRHWWIVVSPQEIDICDVDPGFDVRVTVESPLRAMVGVWRGDLSWRQALRSGQLTLHGDPQARRAVTSWLKLSPLAHVPRPEPPPSAEQHEVMAHRSATAWTPT